MFKMIPFLCLLALGQTYDELIEVEANEDASFRCSSDIQVKQSIYLDFTPLGSDSEVTVLSFVKTAQGELTKDQLNSRFDTDGRTVTLQNVQLEDEGTYTCIIRPDGQNKVVIVNKLVIFTKPTEPEITNEVNSARPLQDVHDIDAEDKTKPQSVATCKVDGAKPPAQVTWRFENQDHEVADTIATNQKTGYQGRQTQSLNTFQIIPIKSFNKMEAICVVTWNGQQLYTANFKINVQFKPQPPTIRPNKAQHEVTCTSNGNPEPTIIWLLPDGTTSAVATVPMQDRSNGNATYECTAQNDLGKLSVEKTNFDLQQFVDPVTTGNLGLIMGVVVASLAIICLAGYLVYRFCLDPKMAEKQDQYDYHGGQRDHYVGGSQTALHSAPQRKTPDYEPEYDTDDEPGQIVSQSSSRYHQSRRSNSNVRSTPTRSAVQYEGQPQQDDELVDNAKDRYEHDYNPSYYTRNTVPYKDTYMSMNNYDGSDSQMV